MWFRLLQLRLPLYRYYYSNYDYRYTATTTPTTTTALPLLLLQLRLPPYRYYYSNYDYRYHYHYRYYYSNCDDRYYYYYYKQIVGKGPTFGPRRTRGFPQIGPNLGPERQGDLCNRAGERQGHPLLRLRLPLPLQLLRPPHLRHSSKAASEVLPPLSRPKGQYKLSILLVFHLVWRPTGRPRTSRGFPEDLRPTVLRPPHLRHSLKPIFEVLPP